MATTLYLCHRSKSIFTTYAIKTKYSLLMNFNVSTIVVAVEYCHITRK